ncbi:SOS-response transcriptional repressor LexA (RecA-mediated autopeptidase) [Anaerosporobacter mobilis DSM 15930]|jgi:SOS-response transcriptional repressor LexA|uniref:SOS-response transcriptional repressor LexA (RecA-mediated autopeptidase) n=1 Tax=Anaerosporobacter mobilis DSM 15930 TaxID=1120996 RepID=A0A1M7KE90_9FIRM|nr:S24 family peptidase [Anaerosporobacter mobilis]SHM63631.1 SOS-response transcriptional repressor LexA (RecA-mediated autopeptidase) [Anaerosporobacter mobilis DSM 15930]
MKRLLTFDFVEDAYVIQEDSLTIFSINGSDLQFDSRKFYEGIFKGNNFTTNIEFTNHMVNDVLKKGNYIFSWISSIFSSIKEEFVDSDEEFSMTYEITRDTQSKVILLYDIAACAGNGFYIESSDVQAEDYEVYNNEADFAVRISGQSMEPLIPDGSIVLVKRVEYLDNDDLGIFNIDGDAMCKKYTKNGDSITLVPVNDSEDFKNIILTSDMNCKIQGKVIEVMPIVIK